ncbi:hypothetical protein SHIRM173S_13221 [Streptomyces hirsutus]
MQRRGSGGTRRQAGRRLLRRPPRNGDGVAAAGDASTAEDSARRSERHRRGVQTSAARRRAPPGRPDGDLHGPGQRGRGPAGAQGAARRPRFDGRAQYRSGGIDPSLQLFLSADPDDDLDKASALDQLSTQQVDALKEIQEKQRELAQQRSEASEKLKDLSSTRTELGKKKTEVQNKLGAAQKLLNTLTAEEKAQLAEEEDRATRASEREVLKATSTDTGSSASVGSGSGRAGAAFAAAQSKLGTPYVYGATGPSSYDCSGLTSWAYAQAGVSIPRTSEAQTGAGTKIYSASQLQVGDLVFFLTTCTTWVSTRATARSSTPRAAAPSSATSR